jgi:hypothetical protein
MLGHLKCSIDVCCGECWLVPLLVTAGAPQGVSYDVSNMYLFKAVEVVSIADQERALATVAGGALLSAAMGPEASRHGRSSLQPKLLATFILAAGLCTLQVRLTS